MPWSADYPSKQNGSSRVNAAMCRIVRLRRRSKAVIRIEQGGAPRLAAHPILAPRMGPSGSLLLRPWRDHSLHMMDVPRKKVHPETRNDTMATRIEKDFLGEKELPDTAYYGVQTL